MFGWIIDTSVIRYPTALTITEIKKQLGVSSTGATNLKRRFQIFCSEQQQKYKELIHRDLKKLTKIQMPALGEDVRALNAKHRFPTTDTMAVFSASQRVSKGRQRWKAGAKGNGLTSSIYLNSHLGGRQIGSLINTFSVPGRGLILDAIPNQEAGTIGPLIREYVPRGTPLYSDEGLRWYKRENPNHRMVNHSKKSKSKRYRYAKDRWSIAGVNIQSSEGTHSVLKATLRTYRYIQPRHMPLYLNEFAFLRNIKVYGYQSLFHDQWSDKAGVGIAVEKYPHAIGVSTPLLARVSQWSYTPPTLEERQSQTPKARLIQRCEALQQQFVGQIWQPLREALVKHQNFWTAPTISHRRQKERRYAYLAEQLWQTLPVTGFMTLQEAAESLKIPQRQLYRVVRRWAMLGIADVVDRTPPSLRSIRNTYDLKRSVKELPPVLYVIPQTEYSQIKTTISKSIRREYAKPKRTYRRKHHDQLYQDADS